MSDQDFRIESARAEDAPAVIRLIGRVYEEYGLIFEPAEEVPDLRAFAQHYVAPRGAFYVIRHGGNVVGSVGVERLEGSAAGNAPALSGG